MDAPGPVSPHSVTAQRFVDEQVVVLVPLLREVHPAQLAAAPPPPEQLVDGEHGVVGKVRHARHGFEEPEALDGSIFGIHGVEEVAQDVVGHLDDPGRGYLGAGGPPVCLCVTTMFHKPRLLASYSR